MVKKNVKVGTGVTAYDKEDGATVLIVLNNAIDMASQSMAIWSSNQMRHRGVDVWDVHHKFTVGDRKDCFGLRSVIMNYLLQRTMV